MKRRLSLLITFILLGCMASYAQNITVRGTVKDQKGEPLPGVSVKIKGTALGTSTDINGAYTLRAPGTAILVVSYIGFKTSEIPVNNRSTIQIILSESNQQLDEVVVVGYGTQRKGDVTGAIGTISNKAFDSRPNTQFGSIIQGKTAGVQVVTPSGKPSTGLNIRIRGTSSINAGSDPLYVIDGVPTTDTRSLNPSDIESISVLKDASSAAIYGAQGANGVVLITTKRGKEGAPKVEFNVYGGFSNVWKKLDVLNADQYHSLMTELGYTTDWSKYTANTNWQDEIFRNGTAQNYQVALSGKNDKTTYYLSGGWVQQNGAVRSSQMNRYNFKVNLDQKVNNWLNLGTNVAYTNYHDVDVTDNTNVNSGGVLLGALTTPPVIGIYNADGTFTSNPFQNWENPVASTDGSDRPYKNQRLLGNAYAEITFIPDLKFRSSIGIDYSNAMSDYFLDPFRTSYGRAKQGIGRNSTYLTNYWISDNTLSYKKNIGKHNFSALAGFVAQKFRWENSSIEKNGFSGNAVTTTNAGSIIVSASNDKSEKTNESFISRLTYDFAGKYLVTANFRADGSSVFGPGKRWGYFPSFSAGWRLSEENFMKDLSFVNDLKLRLGWGIVGNDQLGDNRYAYLGQVGTGANYTIGGTILPGTYPSSIENLNLKWEQTEQTNLGIDLSVLNSRITFSADAYIKNTKDLLLNVPVPRSTGFDTGIQNVGKLRNKGLEFQISSVNIDREFKWNTDFNLSFNRNKVIDLVGQQILTGYVANRDNATLIEEGQPLGMLYGYVAAGVDPQTGMLLYKDKEGNSTQTPSTDDRTLIGNPNPDFIYGLTNTFSYKNFSLNVFLQGSQGNDILNASRMETEGLLDPKNQSTAVLRRWTTVGQITDIPKAVANNYDNSRISTRFVENGSFLRVKSATLSYNFASPLLSKIKLSGLKLYVTGENLITITNYKGYDPEVNFAGASNTIMGIDYGTYPQTRNLIFGLSASF